MSTDCRQGGTWSRLRRRPTASRPWWSWAGLLGLVLLSLVLFTWALSRNGMGNTYYAAAVKSADASLKAWFFGASDPGSFMTVDKLPASLWLGGLFARVFGFSSWAILLPQALAGVASVVVLHHLVRRWQGDAAALLAALAFALTPVAVVMFRLNIPDALLTLLLLCAAWALWSALETGSTWKVVLCGVLVGLAFLTKMLEVLLVLPAFVAVYLVCGPRRLGRRLLQLLAGAAALVVTGGWWVAVVELWPETARPYIGGSTSNSVLDLVFSRTAGYLDTPGPVPDFAGNPGWLRLFNDQFGGQIAWLIPPALAGLAAGLWWTRRRPRSDRARAGFLLWGAWTLVCLVVFSMAKGVIHPYYTVVLAPSVAALVGGGAVVLWRLGNESRWLAWLLPAAVAGTAVLARELLARTPAYVPALRTVILIVAGLATAALLAALLAAPTRSPRSRALVVVAGVMATVSVLAGPAAYSVSTVARAVDGTFATAGPEAAMRFAFNATQDSASPAGPGETSGGPATGPSQPGGPVQPARFGEQIDGRLVEFLLQNRGDARFLVATQGALVAAPFILATGEPVLTIGGFDGSYPIPSLSEFQRMVEAREVRHVLLGGLGALTGGFGSSLSIALWVQRNGRALESADYGGYAFWCTLYQMW